jgi:phosphatidylserine decarboxylase
MHLLFYGKEQTKILETRRVEELLREESIKVHSSCRRLKWSYIDSRRFQQGRIYDDPKSVDSIPYFVETYSIQTDELLEPDITKYGNFNEFFYRYLRLSLLEVVGCLQNLLIWVCRKLRPGARPIQNAEDEMSICSAADSRLTVYKSVDMAKAIW